MMYTVGIVVTTGVMNMPQENTKLENMLLKAVETLQKASTLPVEEQWFTRADVARQIGAVNGLNPARVNTLKRLVKEGQLQVRQKPDDGRDLPQYQI